MGKSRNYYLVHTRESPTKWLMVFTSGPYESWEDDPRHATKFTLGEAYAIAKAGGYDYEELDK